MKVIEQVFYMAVDSDNSHKILGNIPEIPLR